MAGRNALATPTNVYPRNGNVVILSPKNNNPEDDSFQFTFTCQSDAMAYFGLNVYDATTGKEVRHLVRKAFKNGDPNDIYVYHRGDTVLSYMARCAFDDPTQTFYSGYHYYYKITTYCCVPDVTGQYQNIPNCVVPYASGIVLQVGQDRPDMSVITDTEYIYIQNGILGLREPSYWDGEMIGCTNMRIGHEERTVVSYDRDTGLAIVDRPFPASVLIGDNIQYYLNCNYIESSGAESEGSYDFYIREEIQSVTTAKPVPVGVQCKTTYYQPNNVGLENYRFKLYNTEGDNYYNGSIQATTIETADLVSQTSIPIGTGIIENIVGKVICVAKSVSATFPENIVTSGYTSYIIAYDSTTGIATLFSKLGKIPRAGTLYSIALDDMELIQDSGDVFNYHMCYNFPSYVLGKKLAVETILTTYEKQQYTEMDTLQFPEPLLPCKIISHTTSVDSQKQRLIFRFEDRRSALHSSLQSSSRSTSSRFPIIVAYTLPHRQIYRREKGNSTWHRLGFLNDNVTYTDFLAGNNREYEYMVAEILDRTDNYATYDPSVNYKPYFFECATAWDGWTITSIHPYDADRIFTTEEIITSDGDKKSGFGEIEHYIQKPYFIGDTWRFISNIDSGSITTNLNRTLHVGTSRLPTVTGTNNNYQSGTFAANLLSLDCTTSEDIIDDISKVEAWQKFINDDCLFILKSDKGDVWIVAISENTSRTYDESADPILTSVSYSWVEVEDAKNIQILPDTVHI